MSVNHQGNSLGEIEIEESFFVHSSELIISETSNNRTIKLSSVIEALKNEYDNSKDEQIKKELKQELEELAIIKEEAGESIVFVADYESATKEIAQNIAQDAISNDSQVAIIFEELLLIKKIVERVALKKEANLNSKQSEDANNQSKDIVGVLANRFYELSNREAELIRDRRGEILKMYTKNFHGDIKAFEKELYALGTL
ncbi:hypothetical protein [Poseidonibacter ostreae]|uniref:Uncharacterized protein n=1 Tax=Poseidonibacter ostreae TaxID=2654171 RepID=A0A6L4WX16_9BACT|nr:hypothetical protein [Poseidonibacter ostreae]KAB7891399.1 hypothetical protein GBG19_00755 [Poseidonibacter ostreae]